MGKVGFQPLTKPDVNAIRIKSIECKRASDEERRNAHSLLDSFHHHYQAAITYFEAAGNIEKLKELSGIDPKSKRLAASLATAMARIENHPCIPGSQRTAPIPTRMAASMDHL